MLLLDPTHADVRVLFGMVEAEYEQRALWRASARVFGAIDETLREAAAHPEVFLGFSRLRGRDAVEFAERGAVADLAVRLNLAEGTVRSQGQIARVLRERLPQLWSWFREGEVSTANAREASSLAVELRSEVWAAFDEHLLEPAKTLSPARFRAKARAVREKLHTEAMTVRHARAVETRGVWTEVDRDGMGWLHLKLSAEKVAMATAHLDAHAFELFRDQEETRAMTQLRADIAADLLTGTPTGTRAQGGATVAVALTVPVLSLLGHSDEAPILEGVGPIDIDTARELCGTATSFTRILTHPISGTILTMDAHQYRPTAGMKRWLGIRDVTCTFPGCGRRASTCDLDHTTAWAHGGATTATNLTHLCRKHHRIKHETKWRIEQPPNTPPRWTSPTGHIRSADPPPY